MTSILAPNRYRPIAQPLKPPPRDDAGTGTIGAPPPKPALPPSIGSPAQPMQPVGAPTPAAAHSDRGFEIPGTEEVPPGHETGIVPPPPPPATRPATPVAPKPPSPIAPPPPAITPATSPVGGNLRSDTYTPGDDPRLRGAQDSTDDAASAIQKTRRTTVQAGMEDRYRSIYGNGQVDPNEFGVDPNAQFRRIGTDVNAASIDPNVTHGPNVDASESARTSRYGMAQDSALDGLNGPDRTALAMQKLKDFDAVSDETRFNEERSLGRNISKFGRSGLQSNADNFGDIQRKIAGDRGRLANSLAMDVSEGDINDRFRRVDATAGLRGQESGIDAGIRGERRTERDYGTGLDERNVTRNVNERDFRAGLDSENLDRGRNERDLETALNERNIGRQQGERDARLGIATGNQDRAFDRTRTAIDTATGQTDKGINDVYDRYNAAGSLEDRINSQGQANRGEYRTERSRQDQAAQQTIENRIRERQLQQDEEETRLRRAALQAQAGGL